MMIKTIKAKITIWFAILFLILVGGVMVFLFLVGQSTVYNSTQDKLRELVESNAGELEYLNPDEELGDDEGDHFVEWMDGYLEIDDDFREYSGGVYISLYGDQELLYGENPIGAIPDVLPFRDGELRRVKYERKEYYVYDMQVHGERLEGLWLRGVVNRQEDVPVLLRVSRFMLLALPILAVLAIYGGYQLAKRALKPLDEISDQASSISSGSDLSHRIRIEEKNESRETHQLVDTFNHMFERLHISFEAEKKFTSDASHELRTPVAVILAECEYALDEKDPTEWREALEVISRQGTKMAEMIEELLTFTRLERGTIEARWEEIDLSKIAEEVCREQEKIRKKEIRMHTELQGPVWIRADRKLLERLIRNLVVNAYQYGKEPGNVWVRTYEEDGKKVLSVRDDGIGIDEGDLPNIWNRFYRADNARKDRDSTGLGLSMVKQIAILHHAQTKVFSKIGEGTTFLIFF